MTEFLDYYPSWLKERESCIYEIEELAKDIDKHHRNISIAQLPTSAVGIVGGVLTITGLALIPVTFGASLGLTISGAVIGIGATATGITTSVTDISIQVNRVKKARSLIYKHKESTDKISEVVDELLKNCEDCNEINDEVLTALLMINSGEVTRSSLSSLKGTVFIGASLIRTIPKAAKSLSLLRRGAGLTAAASASSLRTVDVASDVAAGGVKIAATTTGKVLTGLGFAFRAMGIAVDLISAGVAIYDLFNGSTSNSRQLRKVAEDLTAEMNVAKKMYTKLSEM